MNTEGYVWNWIMCSLEAVIHNPRPYSTLLCTYEYFIADLPYLQFPAAAILYSTVSEGLVSWKFDLEKKTIKRKNCDQAIGAETSKSEIIMICLAMYQGYNNFLQCSRNADDLKSLFLLTFLLFSMRFSNLFWKPLTNTFLNANF